MSELRDLMWVEKYRPEKINEFINQESTIKRLKPIIKNLNNIKFMASHSYLHNHLKMI